MHQSVIVLLERVASSTGALNSGSAPHKGHQGVIMLPDSIGGSAPLQKYLLSGFSSGKTLVLLVD